MSDLKIFAKTIESEAKTQIDLLLAQDAFKDCKVRIMPDVHAGAGCVIGFTADLGDKVIPNIVGVDIGCGMLTIEIGRMVGADEEGFPVGENVRDVDYEKLDNAIRRLIPAGRNVHPVAKEEGYDIAYLTHNRARDLILKLRCREHLFNIDRLEHSLGTLGGGNHFIEIDEDSDGNKYLVIHTGSRNLGKQVAEYYQKLAIETLEGKDALRIAKLQLIDEYREQGRCEEISKGLSDLDDAFKAKLLDIPKDLCYLTGEYRDDYLHDMAVCQEFAKANRNQIAWTIMHEFGWMPMGGFETIHNYIENETNMVRKGAISAKEGERLLIPINMRDGCIIGRGKGNPDWNYSAPHGAGRIMSRAKAKGTIALDDYKASMEGIYTTSVGYDTLDESPMAYKPMDEILECIKDTVEIEKIIKPVYNFKAGD